MSDVHPNAIDLEAFACGEPIAKVGAHVASCDACRAYVAKIGGLTAPTMPTPKIQARRFRIELVAIPLAMAAAIILFMRSPAPVAMHEAHAKFPSVPETVAVVDPPPVRFKGGFQLAVVRDRAGKQERFTDSFEIRSGDRLRLEVAVDQSRSILGAVLGDDGSYLELLSEDVRDAGTYFSEKSARIDSEPTAGTLIVGDPALVRAAKTTRNFEGLRTVRVEIEK